MSQFVFVVSLSLGLVSPEAAFAKEPTFWRNYWSKRHKEHLVVDEPVPQPEEGPTVLLIPGTTIGPEFYGPMEARLRGDGFRTVVFAPEDLFTDSLALGAERIGARVESLLAELGQAKLLVVAECDGGVAARYYAQVLGGHERIAHLVTFVSAHNGSKLAGVAAAFSGFQALRDVRPRSDFMQELNAAPFPEGFAMTSIYSCHDPLLVPSETSEVPGATNIRFCDPDRKLRHFDGFWDAEVYARILDALRGAAVAELP